MGKTRWGSGFKLGGGRKGQNGGGVCLIEKDKKGSGDPIMKNII